MIPDYSAQSKYQPKSSDDYTPYLNIYLERYSRQELKELFIDTFYALTHYNQKNIHTDNPILSTLLQRVKALVKIPSGKYYGELVNGVESGMGRATYENGNMYEGEFLCGQREGQGVYKWVNGRTYTGEFSRGYRHGLGRLTFPDGTAHFGYNKDDQWEGPAVYTWPDGRIKFQLYQHNQEHGMYFFMTEDKEEVQYGSMREGKEHGDKYVYRLERKEVWMDDRQIE